MLGFAEFRANIYKFGQSLAARVDIVGEDVASSLLLLCDRLPPFPFSSVTQIIEEDLRRKMQDVFLEFDEIPVAAASIAQVHKARTLDGCLKAVKVLRPDVGRVFKRDIDLMRDIARVFAKFSAFRRFQLLELVETFSGICRLELDLRFEAANAEELRANTKDERNIFYVPYIDWSYTSRRVLTMEWVDAIPVYEVDRLQNRDSLARNLVLCFCNQVYRDRFFHADLHPGNLMIDSSNRIVAVDFGIMGRLDEETCSYIAEILIGFLSKDYHRVAEAHYEAGYIPALKDEFVTACRAIWEPIADVNAQEFSMAELLGQLFKVTADFNMKVQPKLLLLQKTMLLVEGICRQLAPEISLWKIAEFWVREHSENGGCIERLRKSQVYKSLRAVPLLMSKINQSLDIIIACDIHRKNSERSGCGVNLFFIAIIVALLIIIR